MEGDFSELQVPFRLAPNHPLPNFQTTWNLAPTDPIPIIPLDREDGLRRLDAVRWGLLPYWAKDAKRPKLPAFRWEECGHDCHAVAKHCASSWISRRTSVPKRPCCSPPRSRRAR